MQIQVLKGMLRAHTGTRAAMKLRREGWVPATLYGHGEANQHIQLREDDIAQLLHDGHHMMSLELEGTQRHSLIKEIQFDTLGEHVIHVDLARVDLDEVVTTSVPLHIHGSPKGVAAGGILDITHHELPIRGRVMVLPEFIDVEIGELLIGQSIRAKELKLPQGVAVVLDDEEPIVIVHMPRVEAAPAPAEVVAEPEVVGAKKPEEGAAEKPEKSEKPEKPEKQARS